MLYVDSENIREDLERKEKAIDLSNYYYQPNFLSQKEIDFLIEIAEDKTQRATTFSGESNKKEEVMLVGYRQKKMAEIILGYSKR